MVEQELDLQRLLVEVGSRQALGALPQGGAGDVQRRRCGSDLPRRRDRLRRASPISFGGTRTTRSPAANQEALQGHRRHGGSPRSPRPARNPDRAPSRGSSAKPGFTSRRGQLAGELAAARRHRAAGVGVLVGIRSDHDHLHRPFDWWLPSRRTSGGRTSARGDATLLSSRSRGSSEGGERHNDGKSVLVGRQPC